MKKRTCIIFIILMLSMLLLPLMKTNTKAGAVSAVDGRYLAEKPLLGNDGYASDVEKWFRDRLGYRDAIIAAYADLNDKIFTNLISPHYQYGKEGYTFFKLHNNIDYGDYHKQFIKFVGAMQEYCESRGTEFYYVFNPEKESLYSEYLPAGVNYSDEWADNMLAEMKRMGINYIDLRETLSEQVHNGEAVFNQLYDAGHWSHTGAFYGMQALTERMHSDISKVKRLDKAEYKITSDTVEKVFGSNQKINEEVMTYELKSGYVDITGDFATELWRNESNGFFKLIRNDSIKATGINNLLLFEDDLYSQFACARSKETAAISCFQNAINFDYYYNIFKPDVVVFENMEYVLDDGHFDQVSMETASYNPAIMKIYPEKDFTERRNELLAESETFEADAKAVLISGKSIDKIYIEKIPDDALYAYIISDNKVVDLKKDSSGTFTADVRHEDLTTENEVVLYYIDSEAIGHYAYIKVTSELIDIANRTRMSEGTSYNKQDDSYLLRTDLTDNSFRYSAIQIMDSKTGEFYGNISDFSEATGIIQGTYCHTLDSGKYNILLKGNTNLADEYIVYEVNLEKGKSYWYSYTVDELSEKQVVLKDFSFSEGR